MSKKVSIYNQKLEDEMDKFLGVAYRSQLDVSNPKFILDKLLEVYNKTGYPGIYYRIGYLYECGCFKRLGTDKSKEYYELAANKEYVPAMNKLCENTLDEVNTQMMLKGRWFSKAIVDDDAYSKYLLAKYYMMQSIYEDTMSGYFKIGLEIMKSSADQGCSKAIQFMKTIHVEK